MLNLSKLMVRFWSRGLQKVKVNIFWEFLPKKSNIFHFLGHQQQNIKVVLG